MPRLGAVSVLSLATLLAPAALSAQAVISARPGTLNYVEGQATLGDEPIGSGAVGRTLLKAGQTVETTDGHAEVLLTPGVYARLDHNSTLRMVSPDLVRTEIAIEHGRAEVEVDELYKQNNLVVDVGHAQTRLEKRGLYEFDADAGTVRVLDGKADVLMGGSAKGIEVKGGHLLALNGDAKPEGFSEKHYTDDLTEWSGLRSQYLGASNERLATQYASAPGYSGYGGYNPGWAWDPFYSGYTWLPGAGLGWSPFGYGFYSAPYLFGGGYVFGGGYAGSLYGGGLYNGGYGGGYGGYGGGYGRHLPGTAINHGGPVNGMSSAQRGSYSRGGSVPAGGFHGGGMSMGGSAGGGGGHSAGGGGHR